MTLLVNHGNPRPPFRCQPEGRTHAQRPLPGHSWPTRLTSWADPKATSGSGLMAIHPPRARSRRSVPASHSRIDVATWPICSGPWFRATSWASFSAISGPNFRAASCRRIVTCPCHPMSSRLRRNSVTAAPPHLRPFRATTFYSVPPRPPGRASSPKSPWERRNSGASL